MLKSQNERTSERSSKARVVQLGGREIVTEGLHLNFWADISHRCMTASWPAFIGGAALVFIAFNAVFAMLYWIGNQPISNVPGGAYIDYLYFSIETLSTAGYGDMHPDTHYGHFIATVELFTGIFSMSLMTGLIFARFSRPNARLLFAENPVISNHEGVPTLMIRLANERHNIISNATARLWAFKTEVSLEGVSFRRFYDLTLLRNENPALALSWTLYHVLDEESPLYGLDADGLEASNVSLWWWCRDMTSLPRKRSTHESPTTTRIFGSGNATRISSAPRKMADSRLTTAGSMTPWRDDYRIRAMSTISARRIASVLN
jgi:inward rectifier potassium channel